MSTTPPPLPAPAPAQLSTVQKILDDALLATDIIASVASVVPSPAQPFALLALKLLPLAQSAIAAHAATTGQSVDQVIAQLHQIQPV